MIRRIACQQLNRRFWRIRCQLHHILYLTISCSVIYILVPARYPKFTYRADVEDKWRLVSGGYYTNNINRNASRGSTQGTSGKETGTLCPIWLSSLGEVSERIHVRDPPPSIDQIIQQNPRVQRGGLSFPENCTTVQKVAVLITYQDRWLHLRHLLARLHALLQRQQCHYRIFVAEQAGAGTFNKGRLYNAGFVVAMKSGDWDCIILHDVDLIPETDDTLYRCASVPVHMSAGVDTLRYTLMYTELVGGVLSMTPDHYRKINGFSNEYWGWGGEDDDMELRMQRAGLKYLHTSTQFGRYKMVPHSKRTPSPERYRFESSKDTSRTDGLNSLAFLNVQILCVHNHALYTNITIEVGTEPTETPTQKT